MSTKPSHRTISSISVDERKAQAEAAAARRELALQQQASTDLAKRAEKPHTPVYIDFDKGHQKRIELRRMVDQVILKENSHRQAMESLKLLRRIAEDIVKDPSLERKLRRNNPNVKRHLYEASGVLQFLIEIGYNTTRVIDMEEYRVCRVPSGTSLNRVKLCYEILHDAIQRESVRPDEKLAMGRKLEDTEAQKADAMRKFKDDRRDVALRVEKERQTQEAKALQQQVKDLTIE